LDHLYIFTNRLHKTLSEQSGRGIVDKYRKLAKIDSKITPHMFRHTFASMMLEEGIDIRYIQSMLGHSSILTTQIYTHISKNYKRMILKKHPREKFVIYQYNLLQRLSDKLKWVFENHF